MHRAAPFFVSVIVLMAGFFVFLASYLYSGDRIKQAKAHAE
jgi:hypothetical protein